MKRIVSILLLVVALCACKNQAGPNGVKDSLLSKEDSLKNEPFYPIAQYIFDQVKYVDSTPLAIAKITFINGKQVDSVTIDRGEFKTLAKEFFEPDLNQKDLKPKYTESSFEDLTINSLTFSYTTLDKELELQQADVLLRPDNHQVKNVMFRKSRIVGDTSISINGLWKHNMNFQLNYSLQPPSGKSISKQIKVIWDRPMVW